MTQKIQEPLAYISNGTDLTKQGKTITIPSQ